MKFPENLQISILLPTYNQPVLIKDAIESILNQTYKNFELIISNDNSPASDVDKICREYAKKDSRIRYFYQEKNIGCAANMAFCCSQMKNKYFFMFSDDDILAPTFIEKCLNKIHETPQAVACSCKLQYIDEDRKPIQIEWDSNTDLSCNNPIDNIIKWTCCNHWMGNGLMNSEITSKCDLNYKKTFAFDVLYTAQILLHGKIPRIEEPLYTYQVRTKSEDAKSITENNQDFNKYSIISISLDLLLKIFELVFESDKISYPNKLLFYFKMWFNIFKTEHWMKRLDTTPTLKCIDLLFKQKEIADIIHILPYIIYARIK